MATAQPSNIANYGRRLYSYFVSFNNLAVQQGLAIPAFTPDPNAVIVDAYVQVLQAFNGTTPKLDVGFQAGDENVQVLATASGTITAGTFALAIKGQTVAGIAYNVTASALATAINAVLGAGTVSCSGGALPGSAITITFNSTQDQEVAIGVNSSGLTGGTLGVTPSDSGLFSLFASGPVDLTVVSPAVGPAASVVVSGASEGRKVILNQPPSPALNPETGLPVPSTISHELQIVVNSSGAPGGAALAATQGQAKVYFAVEEAISINSTTPPLPLN
jgi:hypothetical protein